METGWALSSEFSRFLAELKTRKAQRNKTITSFLLVYKYMIRKGRKIAYKH
jgi:hypothetical protein